MAHDANRYGVTAYNSAKYGVQTHRPGLDIVFENRVHDDDVARLFGFAAGLVPGVDLYAYLAHLPVERWGLSFLERGSMSCRFLRPVYDGDLVEIAGSEVSGALHLEAVARGEVCAVGHASLETDSHPLPAWDSMGPVLPRAYKVPADEHSLQMDDWLGSHIFDTQTEWATDFLRDMRESETLYLEENAIHPGQIVRMMNWAVIDNVQLVPWLYVSSAVHHLGVAHVGIPLGVRARVTKNWNRSGNRFLELEGVVFSGGSPVAVAGHRIIYRPRQALTAYRSVPDRLGVSDIWDVGD